MKLLKTLIVSIFAAAMLIVTVPTARAAEVGGVYTVRATYYCKCARCNGSANVGKNAIKDGRLAEGQIACNWLPLHSLVEINGDIYKVTDRMAWSIRNGRKCIDFYMDVPHSELSEMGVDIYKLKVIRYGK